MRHRPAVLNRAAPAGGRKPPVGRRRKRNGHIRVANRAVAGIAERALAQIRPRVPNRRRGANRSRNARPRSRIVKLLRRQSPANVRARRRARFRRPLIRRFAQAARPRAVQHGGPRAFASILSAVQRRPRFAGHKLDASRNRRPVKNSHRVKLILPPANVRARRRANPRRNRPVIPDVRRRTIAQVRPRPPNRRQIATRRNRNAFLRRRIVKLRRNQSPATCRAGLEKLHPRAHIRSRNRLAENADGARADARPDGNFIAARRGRGECDGRSVRHRPAVLNRAAPAGGRKPPVGRRRKRNGHIRVANPAVAGIAERALAQIRLRVPNRRRGANRSRNARPRRRIVKLLRRQSLANFRARRRASPRRSLIRRFAQAARPRAVQRRGPRAFASILSAV